MFRGRWARCDSKLWGGEGVQGLFTYACLAYGQTAFTCNDRSSESWQMCRCTYCRLTDGGGREAEMTTSNTEGKKGVVRFQIIEAVQRALDVNALHDRASSDSQACLQV